MTLGKGQFTVGLSEREMSVLLDALDGAVAGAGVDGSVFTVDDFAVLRDQLDARFQY